MRAQKQSFRAVFILITSGLIFTTTGAVAKEKLEAKANYTKKGQPLVLPPYRGEVKKNNAEPETKPLEQSQFEQTRVVSDSERLYPNAQLTDSYVEEFNQIRLTEEAERHEIKSKSAYEERKAQVEREIAARKYKIEGLKLREKTVQAEMDVIETEKNHLEKTFQQSQAELAAVEMKSQDILAAHDLAKQSLNSRAISLQAFIDNLEQTKNKLQASATRSAIEIQKMRSHVSGLESEIAVIEAKKATVEAEEARVRAEWISMKAQVESNKEAIAVSKDRLAAAEQKLAAAEKDYFESKKELVSTEKSKNEIQARVNSEVKRLDQKTYAANRAKAMAFAEKIRVEAEKEKLLYYAETVKQTADQAESQARDSQDHVMQSRLAMETAKSYLSEEVSSTVKQSAKAEKKEAQARELASQAESSDMLEGGRPWTTSKSCNIYQRMSSKSKVIGKTTSPSRIVASVANEEFGWVKILNASGESAFVKSDCGSFSQK